MAAPVPIFSEPEVCDLSLIVGDVLVRGYTEIEICQAFGRLIADCAEAQGMAPTPEDLKAQATAAVHDSHRLARAAGLSEDDIAKEAGR